MNTKPKQVKFGLSEVIRPLSAEKAVAERQLYLSGQLQHNIEKIAESIKITDEQQVLAECIKVIKYLQTEKYNHYSVIEFFTDEKGIARLNVCHMRVVE